MISPYGKPQTTIIGIAGLAGAGSCAAGACVTDPSGVWWWVGAGASIVGAAVLLAFFRDPDRRIPKIKGHVVAPADGRISSIHDIDHYEPLGGPAKCIRIFLSVLDVHVNRSPFYGKVESITHQPGKHLNALKAESAEFNESVTLVFKHPNTGAPVGVVRQVAGAIARRIVCGTAVGEILQRGQRFGLIKFGSTTEVYLPDPEHVDVRVEKGQYVWGGATTVAILTKTAGAGEPETEDADEAESAPT